MTWKERRTVTILLSIAGALFLALLIVFGMIYRQGREEALAEKTGPAGLSDSGAPADPAAYTALRWYNGSATLSFSLDEDGKWIWADGPDFPLNDETVTSVLEALTALKFQQVLPAGEDKSEHGLDTPSATLTATAGTGEQSLVFGKTTTDGDSYYMCMNGDESTVYIVADTLVKLMQTPIYDMCVLPELPDLSEENLRAVTIQGPAPAAEPSEEEGGEEEEGEASPEEPEEEPERPAVSLNARSSGEGQPTLWFEGSDNVTAAPLMQDLLHDLKTMSMAKCVDYFPSDEAAEICGFQNADAILKVEYAAGGADQIFTLAVGARMPDQSGRYVRLEDGAIYALATDSIDAVMTISVAGMRGVVQDPAPAEGQEGGEAQE